MNIYVRQLCAYALLVAMLCIPTAFAAALLHALSPNANFAEWFLMAAPPIFGFGFYYMHPRIPVFHGINYDKDGKFTPPGK